MITQWNDREDDALQGLPLRAQIIYLRGIRRFMNYQTGISGGEERRISLKGLSEIGESYNNRQRVTPGKKEVIVSIEQLKQAGLIERIKDENYLVFYLPKADTHQSVQNNHGTTRAQLGHNYGTQYGTGKPSNGKDHSGNHDIDLNLELFDPPLTTAHIRITDKQVTDNNIIKENKQKKVPVISLLEEFGITEELAQDFITHRKSKKASITKTVLKGFEREAKKAGIEITEAVEISILRNWTAFNADWDWKNNKTNNHKKIDYGEYEPLPVTNLKIVKGERVE